MADSTFEAVQAGNAAPALQQGVQSGVGLAEAQQKMQAMQTQNEAAKQEIVQKQLGGAMSMTDSYIRATPEIRKKMRPMLEKQSQIMGLPVNNMLDAVDANPDLGQQFRQALQTPEGQKQLQDNPALAASLLVSADPLGMHDHMKDFVAAVNDNLKFKTATTIAAQRSQATTEAAGISAQGRVDAANVANGPDSVKAQGLALRADKRYQDTVGKSEDAILSARRAGDIIDKISAGDLKSTPALATELQSQLATLFAAKANPTVYGVSHMENNSAFKKLNQYEGFLSGDAINTITPQQLQQMKLDVGAMETEISKQRAIKVSQAKAGMSGKLKDIFQAKADAFDNPDKVPVPATSAQPVAIPPTAKAPVDLAKLTIKARSLAGTMSKDQMVNYLKQLGVDDAGVATVLKNAGVK